MASPLGYLDLEIYYPVISAGYRNPQIASHLAQSPLNFITQQYNVLFSADPSHVGVEQSYRAGTTHTFSGLLLLRAPNPQCLAVFTEATLSEEKKNIDAARFLLLKLYEDKFRASNYNPALITHVLFTPDYTPLI